MDLVIAANADLMGREAARIAAADLVAAIKNSGQARLLVATGASQFTVLEHLVQHDEIDWSVVDGFHLDEYEGISPDHPASFCKYLKERFVDRVGLRSFRFLRGDQDIEATVSEAAAAVSAAPIDVAMVGIGENAHLAFNDPPADFETNDPYLIVDLDEACRMQQVGEGWFDSLESVPKRAISMSVNQILKSKRIVCSVPDERKAKAVQGSFEGEVCPKTPASILQRHPQTTLLVDEPAASLLSAESQAQAQKVQA
ncbi:Glucosamine-6-phosphate deaminase 1 [Rosistilla carotiformis]|uniref:Glucosamine-6-phosphate deaminase 1 n=1 Tax=Rosistilla carotiformis TaxID=2528017 RepID=A0A518JR14_9BACT|nr:glucosamine-6-phosphate deaminase [Rosistilla carotiformis]QDV67977.1 Glucosamine-6-phosphate deaminase 1 [Rosistilla carotiformis]